MREINELLPDPVDPSIATLSPAFISKEMSSRMSLLLDKEIKLMERAKKEMIYLVKIKDWIKTTFIPLLISMEKEVMARLHTDFSLLIEKWFSVLVSDLSIRLDESFSPIIESRGHELDYSLLFLVAREQQQHYLIV